MKMRYVFIALICSVVMLWSAALYKSAQDKAMSYSNFGGIPVLHEGRVKPLDSFARIYLKRFSGYTAIDGLRASAWLAEVLFDPTAAAHRPIFTVKDKALRTRFGLSPEQKRLSFIDVQAALQDTEEELKTLLAAEQKDLTLDQQAFLQLHDQRAAFLQLMRSMSLVLPLDIEFPEARSDLAGLSYLDISEYLPDLTAELKSIVARKGENIEGYDPQEALLAKAVFHLQMFAFSGEGNTILRLVPKREAWISPWSLMLSGSLKAGDRGYLTQWQNVAETYRTDNTRGFDAFSEVLRRQLYLRDDVSAVRVQVEHWYHVIEPLHLALALYALGIVLMGFGLMREYALAQRGGLGILIAGCAFHTGAIVARIILLGRPPVGTLYESLLFVALVAVVFGLLLGWRGGQKLLMMVGAAVGLSLLLLAPIFIAEGETMQMLQAVLNTNLWLTVHVLTITAGYGFCLLCALSAHGTLALRAFDYRADLLKPLESAVYKLSIWGLLFTAVGTALGGVWADQSWGRFWGWDPKENGALLIVLWLIWIQHGRVANKLSREAFQALCAYLGVVVSLAWFGVNLLSIGLHSYGFTQGIALGLGLFVGFETVIIGALWFKAHLMKGVTSA